MKVAALILAMFLAAVSAAGQVVSLKNDIPESQYLAAEAKAAELLKTANYRSVWTRVHTATNSENFYLSERKLTEVIFPEKVRFLRETFDDNPLRYEQINVGKASFSKLNDEPWNNGSSGGLILSRSESGQVTNQYRYLPAIDFEGTKADFYEYISVRAEHKFRHPISTVTKYVRTTRVWYSADGKILRKVEETSIEGREKIIRGTTTYEYNPKDLKIEAPAIK